MTLETEIILDKMSPFQRATIRTMAIHNIKKKGFGIYEEFYTSDGRRFDFRYAAIDHEIEVLVHER